MTLATIGAMKDFESLIPICVDTESGELIAITSDYGPCIISNILIDPDDTYDIVEELEELYPIIDAYNCTGIVNTEKYTICFYSDREQAEFIDNNTLETVHSTFYDLGEEVNPDEV